MELPQLGERHLVYENPYQKVYTTRATFAEYTKEYYVTDFGPPKISPRNRLVEPS